MPFIHQQKKKEPWFKWAEEETFKTGLRHAIFTPWGDRYKGEWLKNLKSGKGVELQTNGLQYEGDWFFDKPNGWGVRSEYLPKEKRFKLIYTGGHKNGKYHGFGYKHYDDGTYYEGEFKKQRRGGYGRCWYPNKSFYEGQWEKDVYHGYGMFVQGNGNRYEGEWHKGDKSGWGVFYHLDSGQAQPGYWKHGTCITSFMEDINFRQTGVCPTHYPIPPHSLHPDVECLVYLNQVKDQLLKYNEGCQLHKYCYSRPVGPPKKPSLTYPELTATE